MSEHMIRICLWIAAAGAIFFGLVASLYARPEIICLALLIVLFWGMFVTQIRLLLVGVLRWKKSTKFWLMPAVVCAAVISLSLCFGSTAGRHVSDLVFRKHSDEYLKIANAFRDGSLNCVTSCNGDVKMIETATLPADVRQAYGTHCDGGGVLVLFSLKTDVPLVHEGYLFRDYAETGNCSERFGSHGIVWSHVPYVRKLDQHWYRVSDQPGF